MDVIEKYNIVFDGKHRRYVYPLPEKLFDLEFTSPEYLDIGADHLTSDSWANLVAKLASYLLDLREEYLGKILDFAAPWTKSKIFTNEKKINHVEIKPGLYININHTALHSCWLIIDMLDYFAIDFNTCKLVIHRFHKAEPQDAREYFRKQIRIEFRAYLHKNKLLSDEKIEKVFKNLDILNKAFSKRSSGYDDLFLYDDAALFGAVKCKFISEFANTRPDIENAEKLAKKYLDYLTDFYRDCGYYYKQD